MKGVILFVVLTALCSVAASAQNLTELLRLASSHNISNPDSAVYWSDRTLSAFTEKDADTLRLQALFYKGWNLSLLGRFDEAIPVFRTMLTEYQRYNYRLEVIRATGRIGTCYRELIQYDSALFYLHQYDSLVDLHLGLNIIEAKLEIGELFRAMDRPDLSNQYKLEAVRRARAGENRMDRMMSLYYYLDDNSDSLGEPRFRPFLAEYLELTGTRNDDGTVDYGHAGMLLMNYSGDEKLRILEGIVARMRQSNPDKGMLFMMKELTDEYLGHNMLEKAYDSALKGLSASRKINNVTYSITFETALAEILERQGNPGEAIIHLKNYQTLKDSLLTATVMANVDSLRIQFETAKKEQRLADQELALLKSRSERNLLITGIVLLIFLTVFISLFLINRNRLSRQLAQQEMKIQEQRIEQMQKEQQILAINAMLEGQEKERMRIARDLHDGLGGLLTSVKAHFNILEESNTNGKTDADYRKVYDLIDTASTEVRRVSHNMAPQALRLGGLYHALEDLANTTSTGTGPKVIYEWTGPKSQFDDSAGVMIYRIIQELVNNAVKYAQAQNLLIQVNRFDQDFNVIIEDDGKGFDLDTALKTSGIGLSSVQARVDYLGGELDIDTEIGRGTTITIQFKLEESAPAAYGQRTDS